MIPRRLAAAALTLVSLTSCATPDQRVASAIQDGYTNEITGYYGCLAGAADHPEYQYLAQHLDLADPSGDTQAQRDDASVASPIDVRMLQNYREAIEACQKPGVKSIPRYTAFSVAQSQVFLLNDENLSILIDRQETWGEYVTTRDELAGTLPTTLRRWRGEVAMGKPLQMSKWQTVVNATQTELSQREGRVVAW